MARFLLVRLVTDFINYMSSCCCVRHFTRYRLKAVDMRVEKYLQGTYRLICFNLILCVEVSWA